MRVICLILLLALSMVATGCGNRGALYLPESKPVAKPPPPIPNIPVPATSPDAAK